MTNKDVVLKFYENVFNAWDLTDIDSYMRDDYIQHNPTVPDGKQGFIEFATGFFTMKPKMEIVKIGEDGDMVYVFFKCTLEGAGVNKVCDIYRLEDGLLAEHWDVISHIPEDQTAVNGHGDF